MAATAAQKEAAKFREELRGELLARREQVLKLQASIEEHGAEMNEEPGDVIDKSEQVEAWFSKEGIAQHVSEDLRRIDAALMRMDQGEFGVCEVCEEEIPAARLRARPDATSCVGCQEATERQDASRARKTGLGITTSQFFSS